MEKELACFEVYVEPEGNFGKHMDFIFKGYAHLTAKIDYSAFVIAVKKERHIPTV